MKNSRVNELNKNLKGLPTAEFQEKAEGSDFTKEPEPLQKAYCLHEELESISITDLHVSMKDVSTMSINIIAPARLLKLLGATDDEVDIRTGSNCALCSEWHLDSQELHFYMTHDDTQGYLTDVTDLTVVLTDTCLASTMRNFIAEVSAGTTPQVR